MRESGLTVVMGAPSSNERPQIAAVLTGAGKAGIRQYAAARRQDAIKTKSVACWSWRYCDRLRSRGHEVLVMERGYLGDRVKYTSLAWNGLNGHGTFPDYPADNGARFHATGAVLQPWKMDGDYALILGQVPGDMSLQGRDMQPWYEETAQKIKDVHGLPVHFREHPVAIKKGRRLTVRGTVTPEGSLSDALARAAFTVCFNSNSSVDSILAGVPCVVGDTGSMAWDVCGHGIDEIVRPDREAWAYNLAFKQWTVEEIASGAPLRRLFAA